MTSIQTSTLHPRPDLALVLHQTGGGRLLLLLHGDAGVDAVLPLARQLAASHHVLLPAHPDQPLQAGELAAVYLGLLTIEDVTVLGVRSGARIAVEMAVHDSAHRISRVVLLDDADEQDGRIASQDLPTLVIGADDDPAAAVEAFTGTVVDGRVPSLHERPDLYVPVVGDPSGPVDITPTERVVLTAREHGPLYASRRGSGWAINASSLQLVEELCDDTRFAKGFGPGLVHVRQFAGDGLFTADNDDPTWAKGHSILMPAFALGSLKAYHPAMVDVADRLLAAWDRHADDGTPAQVSEDMTRVTLDTIGLAGFGYDFASFQREEPHPFVQAMVRCLSLGQGGPHAVGADPDAARAAFGADVELLRSTVDQVIAERRAAGDTSTDDLLGKMLGAPDPATGELLDDTNIRDQVITFLIAGHETTSGALSFALHYLTRNPAVLHQARAEVDALWGDAPDPRPSFADVAKLRYTRQVLHEALRLWPTAPFFSRATREDTLLAGQYPVRSGDPITVVTPVLHRDPVWGDNVDEFDPQRFAPEAVAARPAGAYKPFGTGERACIGMQFALHEATLLLALVVHRYRLIGQAGYQLRIKQTLTVKPDGFTLTLVRRTDHAPAGAPPTTPAAVPGAVPATGPRSAASRLAPGTTVTVLHGSNLGTAREHADRVSDAIADLGGVTVRAPLDTATGALPTGSPLVDRAAVDVSADSDETVEAFTAALGTALLQRYGVAASTSDTPDTPAEEPCAYAVEVLTGGPHSALAARHGLLPMTVVEAHDLVDPRAVTRAKRFLRLELPTGTGYRTADHLAVLPVNAPALVDHAARVLGVDLDAVLSIRAHRPGRRTLPVDHPVTARDLLTHHLDLGDQPTRAQLDLLAEADPCPPERDHLRTLTGDLPPTLELLDQLPALRGRLDWPTLLELFGPLRPRHYSISSSPATSPGHADLMVSLLCDPGGHQGAASSYLHRVHPGDTVLARVDPCREAFRMPTDSDTPLIMVSAGTGLAPFRAAIAERVLATGALAPALCYVGCERPAAVLHADELTAADRAGVISLRPVFSAQPERGARYVQDRLVAEADQVWAMLQQGARVLVCGDGTGMAPGVRQALQQVHARATGAGHDATQAWWQELSASGRYVEDVHAGR